LHDLITIDAIPPGALSTAEIDATMAYAEAEKAAATRTAYAADWKDFAAWCAARAATPLPAHQGLVAAYLSALAQSGRKASIIGRRAAAIAHRHKLAGHEPPTNGEGVKTTLRGIRRSIGTARLQKAPATHDLVGQMLAACPDNLRGLRDKALIAFGFATAMRRSELVALTVEDLTWVEDGVRVLIRRSKTDQEGEGQCIAVPHGYRLRPVEHLKRWLEAAAISSGPLFREVSRGRVGEQALTAQVVALRTKRLAKLAGLDPATLSGHSLRSGYITSAARSGASIWKLADQSRHRSLDTLRGYVRDGQLFVEHSGAAFL
jgi:integrase